MTLISLRRLSCHFIFLSKTIFVLFTCVHFFLLKLELTIYVLLKIQLFQQLRTTNNHMLPALVTLMVVKCFHHTKPLRHKGFVRPLSLNSDRVLSVSFCSTMQSESAGWTSKRGGPLISGFTELLNASWEERGGF